MLACANKEILARDMSVEMKGVTQLKMIQKGNELKRELGVRSFFRADIHRSKREN